MQFYCWLINRDISDLTDRLLGALCFLNLWYVHFDDCVLSKIFWFILFLFRCVTGGYLTGVWTPVKDRHYISVKCEKYFFINDDYFDDN